MELTKRDMSEKHVRAKKIKEEFIRRLKREGFTEDEIADVILWRGFEWIGVILKME